MTRARELAELAAAYDSGGLSNMKNRIINGAMVIDQRNAGASVTPTNGQYLVDRWAAALTQASKFSAQQNAGGVTAPAGFVNYLGFTSLSAYSIVAADLFVFSQKIEGFNTSDLGWGTANAQSITLSFWVRSSLTGTFGGALRNDASNRSYPFNYTISAANTWEQKSITIAGDTSGTWLTNGNVGINLNFSLGTGSTYSGTAGAWSGSNFVSATGAVSVVGTNGATFYITGVQLEKGSTATSFDYRPYGTELALCQRYYYRITPDNSKRFASGFAYSTTEALLLIPFMTEMRSVPSALEQTGTATDYRLLNSAASGLAGTAVPTFNNASKYNAGVVFTVGSGLVAGNGTIGFANSASAYLGFSAEL